MINIDLCLPRAASDVCSGSKPAKSDLSAVVIPRGQLSTLAKRQARPTKRILPSSVLLDLNTCFIYFVEVERACVPLFIGFNRRAGIISENMHRRPCLFSLDK